MKYPFDDKTHGRWALDQIERLAQAGYQQIELGPDQLGWMDTDLDYVIDELRSRDVAYTAALLHAFSAALGAYMAMVHKMSAEPGPPEDLLKHFLDYARGLKPYDD